LDDVDDAEGGEDPDVEDNIVVSGDAHAAAAAAKDKVKNSVDAEKAKKVAPENRTTTPYMTKYEKARVLGTRALQIRYGTDGERAQTEVEVVVVANSYAVETLPF
jgi:DNA-directed RNA polymerase I, II, and III subunit RPABC2